MNAGQPLVRGATLFSPQRMQDPQMRRYLTERFGETPFWLISVSAEMFAVINKPLQKVGFGFAACLSPSGRFNAVMMLQFGATQLRCAVGLDNPLLGDVFAEARRTGTTPMAFISEDGEATALFSCRVHVDELESLSRLESTSGLSLERRIMELTITAANCRAIDELPSIVEGRQLDAVEVTVVLDGEALLDDGGAEQPSHSMFEAGPSFGPRKATDTVH